MTPEFIERVRRDFNNEKSVHDWESYLAGYLAALKRFGQLRENYRDTKHSVGE